MKEELNVKKEKKTIIYVVQHVPTSAIIKVDMVGGILLKPEASFLIPYLQYKFGLQ